MKLTLSIYFIFILISCKSKSVDGNLTYASEGEEFTEFFNKFKSDSLFQIERVKFPWKIPTEEGRTFEIGKTEWLHADFFYDKKYAMRPVDAYTQEIVTYGDTIKIEQRGVDNGIHIDFVFAKIDNKWFLCYESDLSD